MQETHGVLRRCPGCSREAGASWRSTGTGGAWFCSSCWDVWDRQDRPWIMASDLDLLFRRHGSDKSSVVHGYAKAYELLFAPIRKSASRLLEVGIGTTRPDAPSTMHYLLRDGVAPQYRPGASARAWRDYFPNCEVVAVDVDPATMIEGEHRITTLVGDSTSSETATTLERMYGPSTFDVVIDDGFHTAEHQIATLRVVAPGAPRRDVHHRGCEVATGGASPFSAWRGLG